MGNSFSSYERSLQGLSALVFAHRNMENKTQEWNTLSNVEQGNLCGGSFTMVYEPTLAGSCQIRGENPNKAEQN